MQQWFGGILDKAREAAPGLFLTPGGEPNGYQPGGNCNEITFSAEKATPLASDRRAVEFSSDLGSPLRHDRGGAASFGSPVREESQGTEEASHGGFDRRCASFATDVDGGYDEDCRHSFGAGFGRMEASSSSPQRPAGPPVVCHMDDGLVTTPSGIGVPRGTCDIDINTQDPYESYRANANPDGPYDHVPPTTHSLQMPPENYGVPPVPYPAVSRGASHGETDSARPPPCGAYSGYSRPDTDPQGGYSPPGTSPCGGYSPPGTVAVGEQFPQTLGMTLAVVKPSRAGSTAEDSRQRAAWAPGSIVEVYSSSAGSWSVANVIKLAAGEKGDVLTVQFVTDDGPKQKGLWRCDRHIVPLGSRGGVPELPPGFQVRASRSRPGQEVFLDATTGVKYASLEIAWTMHFERLAKNTPSGLEMTVAGPQLRRLQEEREAFPVATAGASCSLAPQVPLPCYEQLLTEGHPASPSCQPERPPPISLAELMNMKAPHTPSQSSFAGPPGRSHPLPMSQSGDCGSAQAGSAVMNHHLPMSQSGDWGRAPHGGPSMMSHQLPVPLMSAAQSSAPTSTLAPGPVPTMGGKIALPSFGERAPRDSQAAYLHHLADPGFAPTSATPFTDRSVATAQGCGDPYASMHGLTSGQAPSVPQRPAPAQRPPPYQGRPGSQPGSQWGEDPFSQWRA